MSKAAQTALDRDPEGGLQASFEYMLDADDTTLYSEKMGIWSRQSLEALQSDGFWLSVRARLAWGKAAGARKR
eukprot:237543-Pyramimonas_sp.AAC.1